MRVTHAEFILSNTEVAKCPKDQFPEYAFIGRSNVGKSSLINTLCGRKNLAKTSGRPGKTQLINHFKINKKWFLVDLPWLWVCENIKNYEKSISRANHTLF